jgi:hypothetical protein
MKLTWTREKDCLETGGIVFTVTNIVRNEIDPSHVRNLHVPSEVRRAVVNGSWGDPYMPRKFPKGTWQITAVEDTTEADFAPVKIRTNAHQMVETWLLDKGGGYDKPTGLMVNDSGYHLHWCAGSRSTLGCGRVGTDSPKQVLKLAKMIRTAMSAGEVVTLEVI